MHLLYPIIWAVVIAPSYANAAQVIELRVGEVNFSVCQVDLLTDKLRMYWKSETGQVYGSFEALSAALQARNGKLVCGINGGIFDELQKPLGLYIENGKVLRHLNVRRNAYGNFYLQPNGVFSLYAGRAEIISTDDYLARSEAERNLIEFANQSGPILIQNGQINPLLRPGSDNTVSRNAVCLRSPTNLLLVLASDKINFYDFARALKERLGCQSALYLDGGLSEFYPSVSLKFSRSLGVLFAVHKP